MHGWGEIGRPRFGLRCFIGPSDTLSNLSTRTWYRCRSAVASNALPAVNALPTEGTYFAGDTRHGLAMTQGTCGDYRAGTFKCKRGCATVRLSRLTSPTYCCRGAGSTV